MTFALVLVFAFFSAFFGQELSNESLAIGTSGSRLYGEARSVRIVYVGLQLPLQYSSIERHRNLERMRSHIRHFHIIEGFHAKNNTAINSLIQFCVEHDLYITPHYFNDAMMHINIGKPAIISSFLKVFDFITSHPDYRKYDCLVVVEDDFYLDSSEREDFEVLRKSCRELIDPQQKKLWFRFERYNTINLYNIRKLPSVPEMYMNTTIENPFDDYSMKHHLYKSFEKQKLLQSKWTKMNSTLLNSKYIVIKEWNSCLNSVKRNISADFSSDQLVCNFSWKKNNRMVKKPPGSKVKSPYYRHKT